MQGSYHKNENDSYSFWSLKMQPPYLKSDLLVSFVVSILAEERTNGIGMIYKNASVIRWVIPNE